MASCNFYFTRPQMLVQHTVTTSNVYSIFFIAQKGRLVTQVCHRHAGWSTHCGGGLSVADTWVPSSCWEVQVSPPTRSAGRPCTSARLLVCYLPWGWRGQQKRLLQDCLGHRRRTSFKKLFYFNCKLLQCNKTSLFTKS